MAQTQISVSLLLIAFLGCLLQPSQAHKNHVVGGAFGWMIPPNATFYKDWAATKTFVVGDKLVFLYRSGAENVMEVSAEDFEKCGDRNVTEMYFLAPTIVELTTPGSHFFYSEIGLHCEEGQKLAVNVVTTAPPPPFVADDSLYSLDPEPVAAASPAPLPAAVSGAASVAGVAAAVAALYAYFLHAVLFMIM